MNVEDKEKKIMSRIDSVVFNQDGTWVEIERRIEQEVPILFDFLYDEGFNEGVRYAEEDDPDEDMFVMALYLDDINKNIRLPDYSHIIVACAVEWLLKRNSAVNDLMAYNDIVRSFRDDKYVFCGLCAYIYSEGFEYGEFHVRGE